jgi:hypothetical protein
MYKSDVYFNVIPPMPKVEESMYSSSNGMHYGDISISMNKIYLRDNDQCYKANISDIKKIEAQPNQKQILIHFWNLNMIISCKKYSKLLELYDFISFSYNNLVSRDYLLLGLNAATATGAWESNDKMSKLNLEV